MFFEIFRADAPGEKNSPVNSLRPASWTNRVASRVELEALRHGNNCRTYRFLWLQGSFGANDTGPTDFKVVVSLYRG